MTQEEIRKKRAVLDERLKLLRGDERLILTEMANLKDLCTHPNQRRISVMGKETPMYCPDCEWQS